ncbi:MAG TPA: hypothetical protein VFR81_07430 [Longimicrobium sp.]|nr:hypothetical protein [Longimicrobium sp.]
MRKLHLKIDDLAVESFQTDKGGKRGGTVRGYLTEVETCTQWQTRIDTCNSEDSECATCQVGGCPGDTQTCYFGTCGRTDGFNVCFGC